MNVSDRDQIVEAINLYGWAIDARRWDLFDRIFAPDIDARYGGGRHWTSLAVWKEEFAAAHEPFDHTQHAMLSHLVDIDGGTAQALTYVAWRLVRQVAEGQEVREGTAWYDDALRRYDTGWRIERRRCETCWAEVRVISHGDAEMALTQAHSRPLRDAVAAGDVRFLQRM